MWDGKKPPAWTADGDPLYLLGTDNQGRDMLSTILYGGRISLAVGFAAVALGMVIGVSLGVVSGYLGGWFDAVIMRLADVQLTIPGILTAILINGILRSVLPPELRDELAIYVVILAIGLSDWPQFARVARGATLVEAQREYVQAARVIGLGTRHHHDPTHPAQRAPPGVGFGHHRAGARNYCGGDTVVPWVKVYRRRRLL